MPMIVGLVVFIALIVGGLAIFAKVVQRGVERALPPRGRFLDVDGQTIHYLDVGNGPPLLLVHGLGGQMGNFTYFLAGRLADDFRLIIVDRPGAGYSKRPAGTPCNVRAQAATLARFADALGLERPLVVGHSLGGAIALAMAVDHPQTVSGVALISALTQPEEEVPVAFRALAVRSTWLRKLIGWTVAVPMGILRGPETAAFVFAPEPVPTDFATRGGGALSLRPASYENTSADLMAAGEDMPALAAGYASLACPVGIVFGTEDTLLDHRRHALVLKEQLPGLIAEIVPGGHMLPVTQPDVTAALIRAVVAVRG